MAILCGVTGALSAFYHDLTDISDPTQRLIASPPHCKNANIGSDGVINIQWSAF